jgi:hypothetical protein
VQGGVSAYLWEQLGNSGATAGAGLLVDGVPNNRYAICRGFFRHVGPGASMVSSSANNAAIITVAWYHAGDSTSTVVALNNSATARYGYVSASGANPPVRYTLYRVSETQPCVGIGEYQAGDSLLLPAYSITTFVGKDQAPAPPNQPPLFAADTVQVTVRAGADTTWTVRATDPDGDTLVYGFAFGVTYISQIDDSTLRIAPTVSDSSATILVVTYDGNGGRDSLLLHIIVEPAVGLPSVAPPRSAGPVHTRQLFDIRGRRLPTAGAAAGVFILYARQEEARAQAQVRCSQLPGQRQ